MNCVFSQRHWRWLRLLTFGNCYAFSPWQVAKKIGKNFLPSAIQVRFAGCKGVLTLDPRLPDNVAVFRPSMRKFESSHRRIEVLQTSRPQAVFLNHQLIILLSNLGIPDDVFMNLQRDMLDRLAGKNVIIDLFRWTTFVIKGIGTITWNSNHEAYKTSFVV